MSANRWSDTRIFETIANGTLLSQLFPDSYDEEDYDWWVFEMDGREKATLLAEKAAARGYVTGVWAVNFHPSMYVTAFYAPEPFALEAKKGVAYLDLGMGVARIWQMGSNGMLYPMMGAWNWSTANTRPRKK